MLRTAFETPFADVSPRGVWSSSHPGVQREAALAPTTATSSTGGVVVDTTNPIDVDAFELLELEAGSAAQDIAAKAPGAQVVKAFNTTSAGTLAEGEVAGQHLESACLTTSRGHRRRDCMARRRSAT